jgi:hypothetical protein
MQNKLQDIKSLLKIFLSSVKEARESQKRSELRILMKVITGLLLLQPYGFICRKL